MICLDCRDGEKTIGVALVMWWAKYAPQVGIRSTDLPKVGGATGTHGTHGIPVPASLGWRKMCIYHMMFFVIYHILRWHSFWFTYTQIKATNDQIKEM